jgi:hypothetical protein
MASELTNKAGTWRFLQSLLVRTCGSAVNLKPVVAGGRCAMYTSVNGQMDQKKDSH